MDSRCHEKSLSARFGSDALDHLRAAIRATLMAHAQERINGPCASARPSWVFVRLLAASTVIQYDTI